MKTSLNCPHCGREIEKYRNPIPTVDIIIRMPTPSNESGIILIHRKNIPVDWAIPGGFVDYGESCETTAIREAMEETSLQIRELNQFRVYSDPDRDPRHHTITVVFSGIGEGIPRAGDDADDIGLFTKETIPTHLAFDHSRILYDFFNWIESV